VKSKLQHFFLSFPLQLPEDATVARVFAGQCHSGFSPPQAIFTLGALRKMEKAKTAFLVIQKGVENKNLPNAFLVHLPMKQSLM
jgi:hypothetical protein